MSPERAKQILAARGPFGSLPYAEPVTRHVTTLTPGGITSDEHAAIMHQWGSMSGSSSYFDALCAIANTPPDRVNPNH